MTNAIINRKDNSEFYSAWRDRANSKSLTAVDMLLYCLLTGKDVYAAFTHVTNKIKLENGAHPIWALKLAHADLKWDMRGIKELWFKPFLTAEQFECLTKTVAAKRY